MNVLKKSSLKRSFDETSIRNGLYGVKASMIPGTLSKKSPQELARRLPLQSEHDSHHQVWVVPMTPMYEPDHSLTAPTTRPTNPDRLTPQR